MNITIQTNALQEIKIETKSFSGGERHVQLHNLPDARPKHVDVQCIINSSDGLMDLLLLQNALNHHYQSVVTMNLEIPYLPYARQDRVCAKGQAFSLEVMANLLKTLNIGQLTVWDCHSPVGLALANARNIEAIEIIEHHKELVELLQHKDSVLICPDNGALNRCTELSYHFNMQQMVLCEKIRDPETGKIIHTQVNTDDLTGKTAIFTDDICDGGSTFIRIAETIKNIKRSQNHIVCYPRHFQ